MHISRSMWSCKATMLVSLRWDFSQSAALSASRPMPLSQERELRLDTSVHEIDFVNGAVNRLSHLFSDAMDERLRGCLTLVRVHHEADEVLRIDFTDDVLVVALDFGRVAIGLSAADLLSLHGGSLSLGLSFLRAGRDQGFRSLLAEVFSNLWRGLVSTHLDQPIIVTELDADGGEVLVAGASEPVLKRASWGVFTVMPMR